MDATQPHPPPSPVRDNYGFVVPETYESLYKLYGPVWEAEETEREVLWTNYLAQQAAASSDDGRFATLEDLCNTCISDAVNIARSEDEGSPDRQKLEELVKRGIPFAIRGRVWSELLDTSVRKRKDYYHDLVTRTLGDLQYRGAIEIEEIREQAAAASAALQDAAALHGLPGYAAVTEDELATWRANSRVWLTQIEKDLPRTFPGLKLMELSGRPALRRVLAAYSLHNSRVGYCQGLNFVAGTLLLFLDEEDAFWCLCAALEDILRGYYDVDMMGMQVDQRVFKRLVCEHFPHLTEYLEGLGADVSCVFVQWFLCVFVNFLPIEACLRVWDTLFYYRSPTVLFKTALSLLEVFEPALSSASDVLDALDLLQSLAPLTYDSSRLVTRAFGHALEGVTDARLETLRREFRAELEAEAAEAAMADDGPWEPPAQPHHQQQHQQHQQQQQPSKMSVLKMFARGMKEKLTGGGGSGGITAPPAASSGANSVERAASPSPEAMAVFTAGAGAGGVASGLMQSLSLRSSGPGIGPAAAATGPGGGADEPLLVQTSLTLDGGGGGGGGAGEAAAGEEVFQFEQVGYVAPSDVSDTASNAPVVVAGGVADDPLGSLFATNSGSGSLIGPLVTAAPAGAGLRASASAASLGAAHADTGAAAGRPVQQQQQGGAGQLPPRAPGAAAHPAGVSSSKSFRRSGTSSSLGAAPADEQAGAAAAPASRPGSLPPPAPAHPRSKSTADATPGSYTWHETPKWATMRSASVAVVNAAAAAGGSSADAAPMSPRSTSAPAADDPLRDLDPFSPAAAALAATLASSPQPSTPSAGSGAAAPFSQQPNQMSPQLLLMTASPSAASTPVLARISSANRQGSTRSKPSAGGAAGPVDLASAASYGRIPSLNTQISIPDLDDLLAEPSPGLASYAQGSGMQQHQAQQGDGGSGRGPTGDGTPGTAAASSSSPDAANFSQVQAADQARRAQSSKRRSTRAAQMAWDIALAPLIRRLEQQGKQQHRAGGPGGGVTDAEEAQRQLQQQQLLLQRVLEMQGSPSSCPALSAPPPPGGGGGGQHVASGPSAAAVAATGVQRPGAVPQGNGAGRGVCGGLKPKVASASGAAHGTPAHTPWDAKAAEAAAASAAAGGPGVHATPGLAAAGAAGAATPGGVHGGGVGPRSRVATPAAPIPAAASPYGRYGHAVQHNGGTYGQAGSSVTSTGSMLILDEHREASPAEARGDEWVIMASPSEGPQSGTHARHAAAGPGAGAVAGHAHGHTPHGPRTGGDPHARVHNPPESTPRPSQPNNGPTANGQRPGAAAAVASATAATPQAQVAGGRAPLTHPGEQQQGPGGMGRAGGAGPGAQGSSDDGGPEEEEEQLDPLRRSSTVGWSSPGMELKVANELREKHGLDDLLQHQEQLQRRLQAVQLQQQQHQAPGQGPALPADVGRAAAAAEPSAPINPQSDLLGVSACLDRLSRLENILTALSRPALAPPSPARPPADPTTLPSLPDASSTTDNVTTANATASNAQGVSVPLGRSGAYARGSTGSLTQLVPLSLQLPQPTPGSLVDEVVVEPGGRVVSKQQQQQQLQQQQQQQQVVITSAGRSPGVQAAGLDAGTGGSREAQGQAAQASALCWELRRELAAGGRRCGEAMELLMQYGVLAEVLSARLADVVRELAEKECSVRDLNEKLYRTFDRVAEQESELDEKDSAIAALRLALENPSMGGGAALQQQAMALQALQQQHQQQQHQQRNQFASGGSGSSSGQHAYGAHAQAGSRGPGSGFGSALGGFLHGQGAGAGAGGGGGLQQQGQGQGSGSGLLGGVVRGQAQGSGGSGYGDGLRGGSPTRSGGPSNDTWLMRQLKSRIAKYGATREGEQE